MSDVMTIIFAIGAGIFTIIGLHFYSVMMSRTKNHVLRVLSLPLFIILFVGGAVLGCTMILIFLVGDTTRPTHGNWGFLTLLVWIGTVGIYIFFNLGSLKKRFDGTGPDRQQSRTLDPDTTCPSGRGHKLGYVPELDGLRGFAILCVMICHGTQHLPGGFIGVDIFFVLSGLLITALLIEEFARANTISMLNFYQRRVFRLVPALAAMLMTYCLLTLIIRGPRSGVGSCIDAAVAFAYVTNWAQVFGFHSSFYLRHTWSLSVEEQFYILWPFILVTLLRITNVKGQAVLVACAIALFSWLLRACLCAHAAALDSIYIRLDTRADSLMIGCALGAVLFSRMVTERAKKMLQRLMVILAPLSFSGLIALSFFADVKDPRMYYFGFELVDFLTAALIIDVFFGHRSIIQKVLAMKWLVWVGSISYGLYLWHYIVYLTLYGMDFNSMATFTVGSLVTFLVAALSYYAMEKPILRLKRR
jgi:peptidoglycan/LPS O-acetylase OafA/YrhL